MIEFDSCLWERQPCLFGFYGQILFWTDDDFNQINEQLIALVMGWA